MERSQIPNDPRLLGVPSGASKTMSKPMVRSTQTVHLSSVMISTISKWTENELPLEPRHLGVPSGVSKMISEPMVRLAQTMHVPCADTNTVSKRTKTRFHMTPSPMSSIAYDQNDFRAYGTFGANLAPILSHD